MEISNMDRINAIIADPEHKPMTLAEIISEEVKEFENSPQYKNMAEADMYYRNRSSVQEKSVDIDGRSNTKIEHPILKKFIDQKTNYFLGKPWTVSTSDTKYGDILTKIFNQTFRRKIKSLGKHAIKSGIAWIQPYFSEEGELKFMVLPSTEVIPLWNDAEKSELGGFIHVYEQTIYIAQNKCAIRHAELWWPGGVKYFKTEPYTTARRASDFFEDRDHGEESNDYTLPHMVIGDKAYNFDEVPIAWLRYNEEELPLCYFIRDFIDDINWQTSITADTLRDISKFIYILKNYGGQDLSEFITDLKRYLAIKTDGDGGVDKLQADLNIDAVMAHLDKLQRDMYAYASAVDTKDPELGNASGTAINFRYMDLDTDCEALANELKETFQRLKIFIDIYLQATGQGDFTEREFDIVFNMDLPVNETDIINNARNSVELISKRTILDNHPWVTDVEEEMARIDEEKQQSMQDFGAGLFDDSLKLNDDAEVNTAGGDDEDEE